MKAKRKIDGQSDFSAGLRPAVSLADQPENAITKGTNVSLDLAGGARRRLGFRRLSTAALAADIYAVYAVPGIGGGGPTVYAVGSNGKLFQGVYTGAFPVAFIDRLGAMTASTNITMAEFRDGTNPIIYVADGGPLNKFNVTTITLTENIAGTPSVNTLAVYNRRLFGITGSDETIYWSGLDNGDTLGIAASGGGLAVVRTFGKSTITGIHVLGGSLFIFHLAGISRFTGWSQDDISIDSGSASVDSSVGCQNQSRALVYEGICWFIGSDGGLYKMDEAGHPVKVSRGKLGAAEEAAICGNVGPLVLDAKNRELWFPSSGGAVNPWVFNLDLESFTISTRPHINEPTTVVMGVGGSPAVLAATQGSAVGYVCDMGVGVKDDVLADGTGGSAISMNLRTGPLQFGDDYALKSVRAGYLTGSTPGTPTISVYDELGVVASTTTGLPGTTDTDCQRFEAKGQGCSLYVDIVDANTTATPRYTDTQLEAFVLNRRGRA